MHVGEVKVAGKESGNDDDGGTVAMRHAKAVIDRRGVQEKDVGAK